MHFGWRHDVQPTKAQVRLAQAVASYATVILDNAQSYTQEREARTTAEALVTERERIAMDLHDGVIQSLFGVALGLGVRARTLDKSAVETRAVLRQAIDQINSAIQEIRSYIFDLRQPQFEEHGLAAELMALTRDAWRNIVMIFSALAILGRIPGVDTALGNYAFFVDPMILEFVLGVLGDRENKDIAPIPLPVSSLKA